LVDDGGTVTLQPFLATGYNSLIGCSELTLLWSGLIVYVCCPGHHEFPWPAYELPIFSYGKVPPLSLEALLEGTWFPVCRVRNCSCLPPLLQAAWCWWGNAFILCQ